MPGQELSIHEAPDLGTGYLCEFATCSLIMFLIYALMQILATLALLWSDSRLSRLVGLAGWLWGAKLSWPLGSPAVPHYLMALQFAWYGHDQAL